MSRAGVACIMHFAFALARSRPRKRLTVVTKSNAQHHAAVMWDEIAAAVAGEFPYVTWDKMLVDAMTTTRMVVRAIERVTADSALYTPDLGGTATTRQVTEAVVGRLREIM